MINKDDQVAKTIAMLAHTLTQLKLPVLIALQVNIKIKMSN
jgi:hypothetical protein